MEYILLFFGSFIVLGFLRMLNTIKNDTNEINKKLNEYIKSQKDK